MYVTKIEVTCYGQTLDYWFYFLFVRFVYLQIWATLCKLVIICEMFFNKLVVSSILRRLGILCLFSMNLKFSQFYRVAVVERDLDARLEEIYFTNDIVEKGHDLNAPVLVALEFQEGR